MVMNKSFSDRESLEQFREKHPELQSLQQILALSEDQFVENYIADFDEDYKRARQVYQTAVNLQAKTALIWANIKDIASPYLKKTLFNNIPQSFIDHQEKIPGYDKLFHNLDYVDSSHCRSILSPAAYFVDLMRFIETYITNPNSIPEDCLLEDRRPDLYNLRLDCDNTYTLIPYIDLVNEILESIIRTIDQPDAYQKLAATNFPINLPFNLPLSEIRLYLEQFKASFRQFIKLFMLRLLEILNTFSANI